MATVAVIPAAVTATATAMALMLPPVANAVDVVEQDESIKTIKLKTKNLIFILQVLYRRICHFIEIIELNVEPFA